MSYVAAAERAVSAEGHVIVDMADFPAADLPAAQLCADRVRGCDVYVGILGRPGESRWTARAVSAVNPSSSPACTSRADRRPSATANPRYTPPAVARCAPDSSRACWRGRAKSTVTVSVLDDPTLAGKTNAWRNELETDLIRYQLCQSGVEVWNVAKVESAC
jgi:hypothetical protein